MNAIKGYKMFKNRVDAGRQLAYALDGFKDDDAVVLAIPRGGLPLGGIVAKALDAPLNVILTKKIGHPYNREYAIGAVGLEGSVINKTIGVTKSYIDNETARIREKLKKQHDKYYKDRSPENLKNKTVLVIDDGMATGNTILVTVELVKKQGPKKIIVAIPVAPKAAIEKLEASPHVSEVICLITPKYFRAVGQFYDQFGQVSDEVAMQLVEESYVNGI
ncbi:phosphoribosyltransferase [Flavobacteriaceae bacterium GF1]